MERAPAAVSAHSAIDVAGCRRYILSRQTPQGGFCFYRHGPWGVEEPNAVDTWAAVSSLQLLGQTVPRRKLLIGWLRERQSDDGGFESLVIAEAVLRTLRQLQAKPLRNPRPYLLARSGRISRGIAKSTAAGIWLANARRSAALFTIHELPLGSLRVALEPLTSRLRDRSGGYVTPGPGVIDTWHTIKLASLVGLRLSAATAEFVRRCENATLGITLTPDTSASSLESQLAGTESLQCLGSPCRYANAIRKFAVRCQADNGGFARVPGALPGLRDTHRALAVLTVLG